MINYRHSKLRFKYLLTIDYEMDSIMKFPEYMNNNWKGGLKTGFIPVNIMSNKINLDMLQQKLHNHTEDSVLDTMERLFSSPEFEDVCTCKQCQLDIATYSLNHLQPKYTSTHRGNLFTKTEDLEQQTNADVVSIVAQAIKIVSKNPHQEK